MVITGYFLFKIYEFVASPGVLARATGAGSQIFGVNTVDPWIASFAFGSDVFGYSCSALIFALIS
jgi:hypothetical protein